MARDNEVELLEGRHHRNSIAKEQPQRPVSSGGIDISTPAGVDREAEAPDTITEGMYNLETIGVAPCRYSCPDLDRCGEGPSKTKLVPVCVRMFQTDYAPECRGVGYNVPPATTRPHEFREGGSERGPRARRKLVGVEHIF